MDFSTIDALTSPTLKHLRARWWDDNFTEFLVETLRPRPGNRILDVGCGEGTAEVRIGRLHVSQIRLVGVDLVFDRVKTAKQQAAGHNQRVGFAVADASRLPFQAGVFDSTFCVAVLQHIADLDTAIRECARVTVEGGRVLAVEPDNKARYSYAATAAGTSAFEASVRFFDAVAAARGDAGDPKVGPKLPALFSQHGIEPLDVRLFPVSRVHLGPPPDEVWDRRLDAIAQAMANASTDTVRALGRTYQQALSAYAAEARSAGSSFIEIQNTMLFATVGQKTE
ncbi:MAG: methyltransferase domain-containing protein [Acidobacteria bacterium]|nr:methyltransferase domain-containing protein [Acidobacteriota bacterium]